MPLFAAIALSVGIALGQVGGGVAPAAPPHQTPALRVGVTDRPPYSWKSATGEWVGPAAELWKEAAQDAHVAYEWVERPEADLLKGVKDGSLDVIASGVQISADLSDEIDFSVPFDAGGYSVLVHNRHASHPWSVLQRIFTFEVMVWVLFIGVATLIAGVAIRLVEGRHNVDHFGHRGPRINGFWWAITTLSTVGYGDLVPRSGLGKCVAAAWMLISLLLVTLFTSSVVATVTVGRITPLFVSIRDIDANLIGVVDLSSSRVAAKHLGLLPRAFPSIDAALQALVTGQVEAVLHPTNELRATIAQRRDPQLRILPKEALRGFVGFGYSKRLPESVTDSLDSAILEFVESPAWVTVSRQLDHHEEQP